MKEITDALTSPVWWVTAVLVGIAVNLVSAYLKPHVDSRFSKFSIWWRNRSEAERQRAAAEVLKLRDSPAARYKAQIYVLREPVLAVYNLLVGLMLMLGAVISEPLVSQENAVSTTLRVVALGLGALSYFLSFLGLYQSIKIRLALYEAINQLPDDVRP